jgi:hypothetical protein
MDWFERLTGFCEADYDTTRSRLVMDGRWLVSRANGGRFDAGVLELRTLDSLRRAAAARSGAAAVPTTVRCLAGDALALHTAPEFAGALFQVASQFNLLEMAGPELTPEHGVTRYADDPTQGPACAVAAGAATIYRNYFVPVGGGTGQTATRQIDALAPLGQALARRLRVPPETLWEMRNGYALARADGLAAIGGLLREAGPATLDALRGRLVIGLHRDVEVTAAPGPPRPRVTQAFCAALPVAYTDIPAPAWEPLATLVLEAAYEATLLAAAEQRLRGGSAKVLLTRLGGGVFGNDARWIDAAIDRALRIARPSGLDVVLVSRGSVQPAMQAIAARWAQAAAPASG